MFVDMSAFRSESRDPGRCIWRLRAEEHITGSTQMGHLDHSLSDDQRIRFKIVQIVQTCEHQRIIVIVSIGALSLVLSPIKVLMRGQGGFEPEEGAGFADKS